MSRSLSVSGKASRVQLHLAEHSWELRRGPYPDPGHARVPSENALQRPNLAKHELANFTSKVAQKRTRDDSSIMTNTKARSRRRRPARHYRRRVHSST